jgi:hypothetical protein
MLIESESELLYEWRFTVNQFLFAKPLEDHEQRFFAPEPFRS